MNNTIDILNTTLAWLYNKEQEVPESMWDITSFLNTLGLKTESQLMGLELAERGYLRTYTRYENRNSFNAAINMSGIQQITPHDVHMLTQVILNTLNSAPDKFHDLSDIPGLEDKAWSQLSEFAKYLIMNGWIEAKALNEKLFVKLTLNGNLYLRTQETQA